MQKKYELPRVSASQIETFLLCPRKWAFQKIDKLEEPETPAQAFGKRGHARIELWLKHGKLNQEDNLGKLISKAMKPGFLPTPSPDLLVESEEVASVVDEHGEFVGNVLGYLDCMVPPCDDIPPLIIDHKFRQSNRFEMTSDELAQDVQANIYAKFAFMRWPRATSVTCRWIYYLTSGKDRKPGSVHKGECSRNPTEVYEFFLERIIPAMMLMRGVRETIADCEGTAMLVKPNFASCDAYGGCFYRDKCQPNANQSFGAVMQQASVGTRAFAKPAEPKKKEEDEMPREKKELSPVEKIRLRQAQREAGAVGANPPEKDKEPPPKKEPETPQATLDLPKPQSKMLKALMEAKKKAREAEEAKRGTCEKSGCQCDADDRAAEKENAQAEAVAAVEAVRHEQHDAENRTLKTGKGQLAVAVNTRTGEIEFAPTGKIVLLINCLQIKGELETSRLEDLVESAAASVCADNHVQAWGLCEYNKGKAELEAAFSAWLDETHFSGTIVCDSRSAVYCALHDVLMHRAEEVMRGL